MLVRGAVEVTDVEARLADDTDGVTTQEQRTQHRFLGLQVVGRDATASVGRCTTSLVASGFELFVDRHGDPTLPGSSCVMEGEQPWVFAVDPVWTTNQICGRGAVDIPVDGRVASAHPSRNF